MCVEEETKTVDTKAAVFVTAEWRYLLMLNYNIDAAVLTPLVPRGTELDVTDYGALVSLVGFRFLNTRLLRIPVPLHRNFDEINLRFYVRRRVDGQWRRGVVFIKEIVARRAVAAVARWFYNENYVTARMSSAVSVPDRRVNCEGRVEYQWGEGLRHSISADFGGLAIMPAAGSEEEFVTEHYWGYTRQGDGSSIEYHVDHPRWLVWPAANVRLSCDVEATYGREYEAALVGEPRSAMVVEGSAVVVHRGKQV